MKRARIPFKASIFRRLLITFLVIMLPIYAIGIGIYNWGFRAIYSEISASMESQSKFILDTLEVEIDKLKVQQMNFLNDRNLINLLNLSSIMTDLERYQAYMNLESKLDAIYFSSSYVEDIVLYLPTINKQYSVSAKGFASLDAKEYAAEKTMLNSSNSIFNLNESGVYLLNTYPQRYLLLTQGQNLEPQCIMEIKLSEQQMVYLLKKMNKYNGSEFLLYNTQDSRSIISSARGGEAQRIYRDALSKAGRRDGANTIVDSGVRYITILASSEDLGLTILRYIPENEIYRSLNFYHLLFWIFCTTSILIILIYSISTHNFIQIPLQRLIRYFKKVEQGDLKMISIDEKRKDEFNYIYQKFNAMVAQIDLLVNQTYRQTILLQKTELKHLQSQINPHFLYNSFFMLERMIKSKDYENSLSLADQLGNYFQFITRNAADMVSLEREVHHAKIYADIQSVRFNERIQINFGSLPQKYAETAVPKLILQPIIENAINHGLKDKEEDGVIDVSFPCVDGQIVILVEDNGAGVSESELSGLMESFHDSTHEMVSECTGIINIHKRLEITFGQGSGITLANKAMGGLSVSIIVRLPAAELPTREGGNA